MADQPNTPPPSQSRPPAGNSDDAPPRPPTALDYHAIGDGAPLDPAAETELWAGRSCWLHFAGTLALATGAVVVITAACLHWSEQEGILKIWLLLVALSAGVAAIRILWRVLSVRYRLTDQRFFIERGILSQTIDQTELIRVDDVRVRKSLPDRLVGTGSVEILSTDVSDAAIVLEGIRSPETIAEHIRTHMRSLRRKSLFIENL